MLREKLSRYTESGAAGANRQIKKTIYLDAGLGPKVVCCLSFPEELYEVCDSQKDVFAEHQGGI